jgi:hypothetical protein
MLWRGTGEAPPVAPFAPDSISDLHAWYKSDTNVTVINDGSEDRVTRWGDVDDAQPLEQGFVNSRPRRIDATHGFTSALNPPDLQNGYPYITGTVSCVVSGLFSNPLTDPFTIVLVRRVLSNVGGSYAYMYSKNSGTSGAGETIRSRHGTKTMAATDTSGGGGSFTVTRYPQTTTFDVWIQVYDGANSASYFNGEANGTGTLPSPIEHDGLKLLYGSFLEVICYDKALSAEEIANLNTYLTNKYTETTFEDRWSMYFDGVDDYVDIYDGAEGSGPILLTASDDFSISAWIKTSSTAAQNQIISFRGTALIWFYTFMSGANRRFKMYLRDDSGNPEDILSYNNSNGWIADDAWTHVVFTRNGTTKDMNLYMNGVSAQVTTTDTTSDDFTAYDKFTIGNDEFTGGRYEFDGYINDVAIWNTELDANTVASIFNSSAPNDLTLGASYTSGSGVDKSGDLIGYWKMGEEAVYNGGTGTPYTIPDASANSNDGTLTNGADTNAKMDTP